MNCIKRSIPLFALTALLGTGCVQQQDFDSLQNRISVQEQRMNVLGSQLSGVQPAQADMWSQVQDLHQDVAYMKGRLEYLESNAGMAQELAEMRDKLTRHEQALRRIASDFALELPMLDAPAVPVDSEDPYAGLEPDPDAAIHGAAGNTDSPAGDESGAIAGADGTTPAGDTDVAAQDTATRLYEQGLEFFNSRQYENALRNFKDFTDVYPTHTLAPNAWFWQGEAQYQMKNYGGAALAYEQVIAKFPRSAKYPAALMKQGICFYSLGKQNVGKLRLDEVIRKFPGTPEAIRAEKFLEENR